MPNPGSPSLWDVGRMLVWPLVCRFLPETAISEAYEPLSTSTAHEPRSGPEARAFTDYLAGPSSISVTSLSDIETFLRGCAYVTSPSRGDDWTALASQFETVRSGNCLDHSLWAWRKLRELEQPSEIVVGIVNPNDVPLMRHAWVVFQLNGQRVRLETIIKTSPEPLLQRIRAETDEYWPEIGVSADGVPFEYAGVVRFRDVDSAFPWLG